MITNLRDDEQHKHTRGGGYVANTAHVADSVFVGEHAVVYGHANLTGKVRVMDSAQVSGHANLSGDVLVCGNRWIDGNFHASTGVFRVNERKETKQERLRPAEG